MGIFDFFNKDKSRFKNSIESSVYDKAPFRFKNMGGVIEVLYLLNGEYIHLFSIENKQYPKDTIKDTEKYKNILNYIEDNSLNYYDSFMLIADDKEDFTKTFDRDIKLILLVNEFKNANKYEKLDFNKFGFKYRDLFLDEGYNEDKNKEIIESGKREYKLKDGRVIYFKFHKAAEYSSGEWIMLDNISFNDEDKIKNEEISYDANAVQSNTNTKLTTEEGIKAFSRIDSANRKVEKLDFDVELKGLFKDSLTSANKLGAYIKEHIELEDKSHIFYNYVELIEKWIDRLIELNELKIDKIEYEKVRVEALKAIPTLKEKIDLEYDRHTLPIVEDLKAEMEAVTKY